MSDLLDLLHELEAADDPRANWTHVCLPTMGYMCGGSILGLADGGPGGHFILGVGSGDSWSKVTCPECRAPGMREVARVQHRQQKPAEHECSPDDCVWMGLPA